VRDDGWQEGVLWGIVNWDSVIRGEGEVCWSGRARYLSTWD
jgi:hypothetical protein